MQSGDLKANSESSKKISIHPLCIASICDHYTRITVGGSRLSPHSPCIGLLFGVQTDLEISIFDAVDSIYIIGSHNEIVQTARDVERIKSMMIAVYPAYELLGWYTLGPEASADHLKFHKSMMAFNDAPLFLLMNPEPSTSTSQLPLSVYETETHTVQDIPTLIFVEIPFKLETIQAERIAVDQVTKISSVDGASTLEVQNQSLSTSIATLQRKMGLLIQVLKMMKEQRIGLDPDILRRANKLCQQLPVVGSKEFDESFTDDLTECLLISYLTAVTKTTSNMSDLAETYTMIFGDSKSHHF